MPFSTRFPRVSEHGNNRVPHLREAKVGIAGDPPSWKPESDKLSGLLRNKRDAVLELIGESKRKQPCLNR